MLNGRSYIRDKIRSNVLKKRSYTKEKFSDSTSDSMDHRTPYQRQGYDSEAIKWTLDWGIRVAGLHRIGIEGYWWYREAMKRMRCWGLCLRGG